MKSDLDDYLDMVCPPKEDKNRSTGDAELDNLLDISNWPKASSPPPNKPVKPLKMGKIALAIYLALAVLIALFVMPLLYIV